MYNNIFILFNSFVQTSNVGAAETVLYSGQISPSMLSVNNIAEAFIGGLTDKGGGTVKVYFGNAGNNTDTLIFETQPVEQWSINVDILPTGSSSVVTTVGSPDVGLSLNTIVSGVNLNIPTFITITGQATASNRLTIVSAAAWATVTTSAPITSCNILVPPVNSSSPSNCSQIDCSNYTPVCFTPTNKSLCGYLQGIDNAVCNINSSIVNLQNEITGVGNLGCANVIMSTASKPYGCIPGTTSGMNLCDWATDVNNLFCTIETTLAAIQADATSGTGQNNGVTDGNNGTLQTLSGLIATSGVTLSVNNNVTHGLSTNSLVVTSSSTGGTQSFSTTTLIPVMAGVTYQSRIFVHATAGSHPVGASISIGINGTGTQTQIPQTTPTVGAWLVDPVLYVPDVNQSVTITVTITNFTSGTFLNFADLVLIPLTSSNASGNFLFNLAQLNDLSNVIDAIANPFVVSGGNITSSSTSLTVTISQASYMMNGKVEFESQANILCQQGKDNYIFYDTWTDSYVVKSVGNGLSAPNADATQLLLYTAISSVSAGIDSTVDLRVLTPFSGSSITPNSITGGSTGNIAPATITVYNLANSGVTGSTYGDATHVGQFAVNAQGQITSATNVNINFPITSVNGLTGGAVSLGLGNLNNVSLTSVGTGNILQYNGSNWVNNSLSVAGVPSFNGSPASNYIAYWTNSGNITGANSFQRGAIYSSDLGMSWNTGNAPTDSLDVHANFNGYSRFKLNNISTGTGAKSGISFLSGGISYLDMYTCGQFFNNTGIYAKYNAVIENLNGGITINAGTPTQPSFLLLATGQTPAVYVDATQHVSVGALPPNSFAALDVQSVNGALLIPRMTTTQKNALTPTNGMMVYDATLNKFSFYQNGAWIQPF